MFGRVARKTRLGHLRLHDLRHSYASIMVAAGVSVKAIKHNNEDRYEETIECCNKALDINPMRDATWDEKAFALCALGKTSEALNCCNKALEVGPSFARVWHTGGSILAELGEYEEAIASFRKYIQVAPPEYRRAVEEARKLIRELEAKRKYR